MLFGSVKLTKNANLDKYKYSGHSIGFDYHSGFLFTHGSFGKNATIFWADMSSYWAYWYNNRLNDIPLTAEAKCPINFIQSGKRFDTLLFVKTTKISVQSKMFLNKKLRTVFK